MANTAMVINGYHETMKPLYEKSLELNCPWDLALIHVMLLTDRMEGHIFLLSIASNHLTCSMYASFKTLKPWRTKFISIQQIAIFYKYVFRPLTQVNKKSPLQSISLYM